VRSLVPAARMLGAQTTKTLTSGGIATHPARKVKLPVVVGDRGRCGSGEAGRSVPRVTNESLKAE
jgi:hypothetical protein